MSPARSRCEERRFAPECTCLRTSQAYEPVLSADQHRGDRSEGGANERNEVRERNP